MRQKVKLTLGANGGEYLCVRGVALVNQQLLVFTEIVRWNGLCVTDPCEISSELLVDTGDQVHEEKPVMFYVVTSRNTRYAVQQQHANAVSNVVQENTYDDLLRSHHIDVTRLIEQHGVRYYEASGDTELRLRHEKNAQYGWMCDAQNDAYHKGEELERTKQQLNCTRLFMGVMVAANIGFFALRAWSAAQPQSSAPADNCKPCPPCSWHPD